MNPPPVSLDQLKPGEKGIIVAVHGSDGLTQRLSDLGFQSGVEVELLGRAPWGDPLRLKVGPWRLGLRKSEASRIVLNAVPR